MINAVRGPARILLIGACIVVIVAGLKQAEPLMVPLVFSAFLAAISAPLMLWLERRMPALLAVSIVVLLVLLALVGVGAVVGGSVNQFVAAAPRYQEGVNQLLAGVGAHLADMGIEIDRELREVLNASAAVGLVAGTLTSLAGMLSNVVLVVLTTAFILFEITTLSKKVRAALDDPTADLSRFTKIATEINQYVAIKTYVSLGTGLTVGLFLWVVGVDFALLWGLLAFLLNYVPNIGSVIAAVPAVLLALVQYGLGRGLVTLAGYLVVNLVIGNFIEPALMGRRLGLSPLVVFLSLLFWGWLWGPVGMLLSVPLTMIVKILLENSQWYGAAVLLGGDPDKETPSLPPPHVRRSVPPGRPSVPPGRSSIPPPSRPSA
ncbi:MAG: AI-2E family transporter [Polyangiaceae bacterium]|nr:AI-2E family transporter [Polyangiaceae bacterium]